MGYYFYNPTENKVFISRHATFLEKEFLFKEVSGSSVELEEIREPQNSTPEVGTSYQQIIEEPKQLFAQVTEVTQGIRRSSRPRHSPERYDKIFLVDETEPTNYKDVTSDPESEKWHEAMNAEMQSMYDNEVWDLVDLPPNNKHVKSKYVFKKKTDMDGNVHTFKARLVAKGFTQTHGDVTWKSSKKKVVAQSTTEAEYIAASKEAQEAAWMKKFIADLGVMSSIEDPIEIFCDNEGAIAQAK
ncbi:uncharacterized protein [Rutidosis leptorrhynchoides]|uniref:uncharacterized protein n=1 Tax=Rutidosis leptorrhynchoides TaxID=125765 RepID=UPI003A99BE47